MPDKLTNYRRKRDPAQTNEPFAPEPTASAGTTQSGAFVVHLHAARRRHFDLRMQFGGVLKSFAIPRGPSLNPQDKRLSVETEDHPLEYVDFEAVIPDGNYGAGAMILWDRGVVTYLEGSAEEGLARGKIDFSLAGYKLRGRFGLIRTSGRKGSEETKQPQWLLVKKTDEHIQTADVTESQPWSVLSGLRVEQLAERDAFRDELKNAAQAAGAAALSSSSKLDRLVPTACAVDGGPLNHPEWLYELKLDGVRIVAHRAGDEVSLRYRTGRLATHSYPEVARAVRALAVDHCVLDGEIVAFDDQGRPDFQRLGPRIQASRPHEVQRASQAVAVTYLVFDVPALCGLDLRQLPLRARKELLQRLLPGKGLVRALDHIPVRGDALMDFCRNQGMEGVIGKRADSLYQSGPERSSNWVKHKCEREDDFIIVGYTEGTGSRRSLGALLLGAYHGDRLVLRGAVGSGLSTGTIEQLIPQLARLSSETATAEGTPAQPGKVIHWVKPELVISIRHAGFTHEGRVRHAVFHGIRADLSPDACTAAPAEEREAIALSATAEDTPAPTPAARGRVALSNQKKIFWPEERYTKGDLCAYYDAVAEILVPYLRDRPVLMVRYPDGVDGKRFYQWHVPRGLPSWIPTFALRSQETDGREVTAFLVNDRDTLMFMANLGTIPIHILASSAFDLERSDFLTLDFDLGGSPLEYAITLARSLRDLLGEIGLPGFPKTSGQTGLHVLVPTCRAPFATTKLLAELLGRILHARHADISTMERMREHRPQGVYIDTGQTGRSRAIVAPYSVRAHPRATVSTPLSWDEVGFNLEPGRHHMFSVPERLQRYGDPMADLLPAKVDIQSAVLSLGKLLGQG